MTWGIIGAMEYEVALLKEKMELERTEEISGLTYHIGALAGHKVVVVMCSVGKVNAALCAQTLVQVYKVDRLVNTGVAGALDIRANVFDVVVSDELCYHDASLGVLERNPPYTSKFVADHDMLRWAVVSTCEVADGAFSCFVGRIVTGDKFISDAAVKADIVERFKPMCVEMEGAAVAHVATMNNIPFVVIRSMSDKADDSAEMSFDEFAPRAAENSARIILKMLELAL